MAHISKHALDEREQNELTIQLTEVIGRLNAKLAKKFILEFLGPEEKIMLAKRLAIVALINESRPIHRIATYLHVSETTVAKIYERYENDEFHCTLQALTKNKRDYSDFINILDSILTVGGIMPYRNYVIKTRH